MEKWVSDGKIIGPLQKRRNRIGTAGIGILLQLIANSKTN
jgi:hypothetical protein